jgi:antitoxin (DNA-binding transcriptional repressor) of toxin-antitoxin stability system
MSTPGVTAVGRALADTGRSVDGVAYGFASHPATGGTEGNDQRRPLDPGGYGRYLASMRSVGTKVLKNELSRYLQLVRRGEVVLVLDRNEVVAELRPPSSPRGEPDSWETVMSALEAAGKIRPARGVGPTITPDDVGPPIQLGASIMDAARNDRF